MSKKKKKKISGIIQKVQWGGGGQKTMGKKANKNKKRDTSQNRQP